VSLYRSDTGVLKTDGALEVAGDLRTGARIRVRDFFFLPEIIYAEAESLTLGAGASVVSDTTASGGKCVYIPSTSSGSIYGPYKRIERGNYLAIFRVKVADNTSTSNLVTFDVVADYGATVFGSRTIKPIDLPAPNTWYNVVFPVNVTKDTSIAEIRATGFVSGITDLYIDYVALVPAFNDLTLLGKLLFNTDVNLYRSAADVLKTDDNFDALALRIGGTEVLSSGRKLYNVDFDVDFLTSGYNLVPNPIPLDSTGWIVGVTGSNTGGFSTESPFPVGGSMYWSGTKGAGYTGDVICSPSLKIPYLVPGVRYSISAYVKSTVRAYFYISLTGAYGIGGSSVLVDKSIDPPSAPTLTAISGNLPANTYRVVVTAVNDNGETTASDYAEITLSSTGGIRVSWTAVDGAKGYNVYCGRSGYEPEFTNPKSYARKQNTDLITTTTFDITTFNVGSFPPQFNTAKWKRITAYGTPTFPVRGNQLRLYVWPSDAYSGTFWVAGAKVEVGRGVSGFPTPLYDHILPFSDNAYNVGSSTYRFKDVYLAKTSGSILFSDGSKVTEDNANLFWDNVNKRLGIGTTSPAEKLDVVGNIKASGYANIGSLQIGGTTVIDSSRNLTNITTIGLTSLSSDPTLSAGLMWFRSDLGRIRYSPDGSKVMTLGAFLIAVDDTQKSVSGTTETTVKQFRFPVTSFNKTDLWHVIVSAWASGGTGYVKFYFDSETSPRLTLSTTSTSETVLESDIDFRSNPLSSGMHTCYVKISNSGSYTTYTQWLGVWNYGV